MNSQLIPLLIRALPLIHILPRLSAHLAEITTNQKYRDAAILSAKFIQAQMIDDSDLVYDIFTLNTTGFCARGNQFLTSDSGSLIEGFTILADVTGDSSWRTRCGDG